jgi:anti-sigma28 factor (negative regulator of flagellin synthesis)
MKIDPRLLDSTGASQASKSQEASGVAPGGGRSGTARADRDADQVQLSGFTGRLLASASADAPGRAAWLQQIASDVRGGNYQVDAMEVSRRMVSEAILQ